VCRCAKLLTCPGKPLVTARLRSCCNMVLQPAARQFVSCCARGYICNTKQFRLYTTYCHFYTCGPKNSPQQRVDSIIEWLDDHVLQRRFLWKHWSFITADLWWEIFASLGEDQHGRMLVLNFLYCLPMIWKVSKYVRIPSFSSQPRKYSYKEGWSETELWIGVYTGRLFPMPIWKYNRPMLLRTILRCCPKL